MAPTSTNSSDSPSSKGQANKKEESAVDQQLEEEIRAKQRGRRSSSSRPLLEEDICAKQRGNSTAARPGAVAVSAAAESISERYSIKETLLSAKQQQQQQQQQPRSSTSRSRSHQQKVGAQSVSGADSMRHMERKLMAIDNPERAVSSTMRNDNDNDHTSTTAQSLESTLLAKQREQGLHCQLPGAHSVSHPGSAGGNQVDLEELTQRKERAMSARPLSGRIEQDILAKQRGSTMQLPQPGAEAVSMVGDAMHRLQEEIQCKQMGGAVLPQACSVRQLVQEDRMSKERAARGTTAAALPPPHASARSFSPLNQLESDVIRVHSLANIHTRTTTTDVEVSKEAAESKYYGRRNDSHQEIKTEGGPSKMDNDQKTLATLAVARPVPEEEEEDPAAAIKTIHADGEVDLEEQRHHEQRQAETKRKRTAWKYKVWTGFCLLLVGIAVGTYFITASDSEEATADTTNARVPRPPQPSLAPTPAPTPYIIDLPASTIQLMERNPESPQARAYRWIANDPYLDQYYNEGQEFRIVQRYALAVLYYSLDGDKWFLKDGWMDYNTSECDWDFKGGYGLPAMEMRGLVESQLVSMIVGGAVTGEPFDWSEFVYTADRPIYPPMPICNPMNELKLLKIHKNNVYGSIPEEIAMISSLALMDISYNDGLIGSLPSSFGTMKMMKYIMMEETAITGTIPSEVGCMEQLRILSTSGTQFAKGTTIPTEMGQLKELTALLLSFSGIEGTIPSEISLAGNLTILDLSSRSDDERLDSIVGTIPSEIGLLKNLHVFTCGNCQLEGTVPVQLGQLTELEMLSIGPSDKIIGTIPPSFGGMTSLKYVQISKSQLSGNIPTELGLLTNLVRMYIMENQLTGTLSSELGKMTSLESVRINGNLLKGTLPVEIVTGWSKSMMTLNISDTMITGMMPQAFCSLPGFFDFECSLDTCGCECPCMYV